MKTITIEDALWDFDPFLPCGINSSSRSWYYLSCRAPCDRIHFPGQMEHSLAYGLTGALLCVGYGKSRDFK